MGEATGPVTRPPPTPGPSDTWSEKQPSLSGWPQALAEGRGLHVDTVSAPTTTPRLAASAVWGVRGPTHPFCQVPQES